jgi:hypothetical protein
MLYSYCKVKEREEMEMAKKKNNEHRGPTWQGYFPRRTKTFKEKKVAQERKEKQRGYDRDA